MFKDTQKELQRLEAELLAQEPEEEEAEALPEDDDFGEIDHYRNFSNRYRAYNADKADWDPEELAQELERPRKKSIWGLCALIMGLIAGIFLLLAWWVAKFNGGFL